MGVAAQHRGNEVIHRQAFADVTKASDRRELVRSIEIAEACNLFVRQALGFLVEPRGLRQESVERAKSKRGWIKRNEAVCHAHGIWVDVDVRNVGGYTLACINRGKAVYQLLQFALGSWTVPEAIHVPRVVSTR